MSTTFPGLMLPRRAVMWFIALGLYGFCKALRWGRRTALSTDEWKSVVYLAAWPFLTTGWLRAGYHVLTVLYVSSTLIFGWAVLR